jgi:miniconductance mechanosensitive channel
MIKDIYQWVSKIPGIDGYEVITTTAIEATAVWLMATIAFFLVKYGLIRAINTVIANSKSHLDDVLIKYKVFGRVAHLIPASVVYKLMPQALTSYPWLSNLIVDAAAIYIVVIVALIVDALINSLLEIYHFQFPGEYRSKASHK